MLFTLLVTESVNLTDSATEIITELFEKHETEVYRYAYRRLQDIHDAECALSDTFIRAVKNVQKLESIAPDERKNYLFVCARSSVIEIINKRLRTVQTDSISNTETNDRGDTYDTDIPDTVNIEDQLVKQEMVDCLKCAILRLEPTDQLFVTYKSFFGMRNTEIAKRLHMNESTVSTRLSRIFKKLRKELQVYMDGTNQ